MILFRLGSACLLCKGDTLCRVLNTMSEHMDNPCINFSSSDNLLVFILSHLI